MPTPFGSTTDGVRALILDVAAAGVRLGSRDERVPDSRVEEWMDEGGARVAVRISGWESLPPRTTVQVESLARHLVHLYAGALLWDAVHPERGGVGGGGPGTRLSDSLMARFDAGLADLATFVSAALEGQVPVAGGAVSAGADAAFPAPRIRETTGF